MGYTWLYMVIYGYIWLYHGCSLLTIPGMHHPRHSATLTPPDLDRRHLQWLSEP